MKLCKTILSLALAFTVSACGKQATISLQNATADIGIQNASRDPLGRVYEWVPGSRPASRAALFPQITDGTKPPNVYIRNYPEGKTVASQVKGFVSGANFAISDAQVLELETESTKSTSIEYSNFKIMELDKTVTAMNNYINADPDTARDEWALDSAIASHKDDDPTNDVYYVVVYQSMLANESKLASGNITGGGVKVPVKGVKSDVSVKFTNASSVQCDGFQPCFVKVRIFKPILTQNNTYSFTTRGVPYDDRAFARALSQK
ncbi:hypothetical protein [Shimia sp. Alg240-R146]|uniref:hypothetical protein n=1 Tax=Shimia sp. Alg240-R146 TaxID=2993449 RepID=UPI0022E384D1|nr:hypothetical protein [Shimia sp. Alg240-R146]